MKNFTILLNFTGKRFLLSLLFWWLRWPATLLKKETLEQVFSGEFCEIFKNTCSYTTPPVAASDYIPSQIRMTRMKKSNKKFKINQKQKIKTSVGTSVTTITNNWTTPHKLSYISNFFICNSRLKLAENIARAKQQPEAELMLFENYTLSSSTLSSQNNKAYFKRREKSMCLCFKENKWKWKWVEVKINHIVRHK